MAAAEAALEESEKGAKDEKKKTTKKADKDILAENADLVEAVGQDKSFDSLSSFTDDIGEKVGSVGSEVSSGATVSQPAMGVILINPNFCLAWLLEEGLGCFRVRKMGGWFT